MTDEPKIYQYQIFLLNGHAFTVSSPEPFKQFLLVAIANQYVLTQTTIIPWHAICFIQATEGVALAQPQADIRSLN